MLNEVKYLQSLHIIYTKNNVRKGKKLSILEYNICRWFVIKHSRNEFRFSVNNWSQIRGLSAPLYWNVNVDNL